MNPLLTTGLDARRPLTALSVNVNKIALLRNQRALAIPSVVGLATIALEAGAHGITVHPRPDERHIRAGDVRELAALLKDWPAGRAQHRRQPVPEPDAAGARAAARSSAPSFPTASSRRLPTTAGTSPPTPSASRR